MPRSRTNTRWFTLTATVLRAPAVDVTSGVRTDPVIVKEGLELTPIDPLSEESKQRVTLETFVDMFEAYTHADEEVLSGDTLQIQETRLTYEVKYAVNWDGALTQLFLERVSNNA